MSHYSDQFSMECHDFFYQKTTEVITSERRQRKLVHICTDQFQGHSHCDVSQSRCMFTIQTVNDS